VAPGVEGSIPFGHPTPPLSAGRSWLLPAAAALVTLAVFSPALLNGFVWDDELNLLANPDYRGLGWHQLRTAFSTVRGGQWIPATWISFGIDYAIWGMRPAGYHLTSLVLHAANAALFYLVVLQLLERVELTPTAVRAGATTAAVFFALHPLRVESVAWITERRDVLSGLFVLLAVFGYLRACEGEALARRRWLAASAGCYVVALASKSIAATLPAVLLVLDVYPLRRLSADWRGWRTSEARRVLIEKLFYAVPAAVVTIVALRAIHRELTPAGSLPVAARVALAVYNVASYVWRTLLPVSLSPLYELPERIDPLAPRFIVSALVVVAITVVLLIARRRGPAALVVWIAYIVMLLPVSGVFHTGYQITTDRYSYLPCLGFAVLVGAGVAVLVRAATEHRVRPVMAQAAVCVVALWLTALGALTWTQVHAWRSDLSLWLTALDADPDCAVCRANLGVALFNLGQPGPAAIELERALTLRPDSLARLEGRLGLALLRSGRPVEAAAHFERVLAQDPTNVVILADLGSALADQGKLREAAGTLERAVASAPRMATARYRLARTYAALGDLEAARAQYVALRALDPGLARQLPPEITR
jgi:tetratricopeptide (TPR) repeat protein